MTFFTEKKLIGGHRGSPLKAKENTLESFEKAIGEGVDFIEFDIRSSGDGNLIVHHDPSVSGFVLSKMSYKDIKMIAPEIGYEIPLLSEVIDICSGKVMLDAEIKEKNITEKTAELLLKNFDPDYFIVTSFSVNSILTLKNQFPEITRGILFNRIPDKNNDQILKTLKPHLLLPHHSIYGEKIKTMCENYNLKSILYTVNDEAKIRNFLNDQYVTGIITDETEKAINISKSHH
jgi:glycerophosphoryl diester phosphodiesterase